MPEKPLQGRSGRTGRGAGAVLALAAAVALGAASPALAQFGFGKNKIQYQSFDWHVYRAPHFDIYYYPEGEPFLDRMVSYAESAYLELSRSFDHEPRFRIPLIYYRTHAEFEQTNIELSSIPEGVGAFAEPLEHRMVLPIDQPPDKLYQLVAHELTHIFEFSILYQDSFGRAVRGSPPGWLMEGLASYMAKDEDNVDRMIIRDAVIHGLVPPITKVYGSAYIVYRYGHAAFDFIESKWGAEGIRTFLSEYRRILLSANIERAIKEAFGIEAEEFDRLFGRYLRKKYLPTLLEKGEPQDYGKEIGFKLPGVVTFSPVLSPSGDLVAVLTTRFEELDVVILSAKDGEVIKNLTRGFSNEYEFVSTSVTEGKTDLTWSPDGDLIAFFVRKENRRMLLVVNALTGRAVRQMEVKVANAASPSFSPDGKKVLFSGNLDGVVDIFELNLESGEVRNITDDEYHDANPSWSADGKTILYNRRVDAYEKVFLLDYEDPSRKTQVTFGPTSEVTPAFTRDGKRIYYTSDAGTEGIFNLYSLDLETGEVRQYTDVAGGIFTPQDLPLDQGRSKVVVTAFSGLRFRLFEADVTKPLKVVTPAERAEETADLKHFEPPLKLTLDEGQKRPYDKLSFHVETAPSVGIGVASDGTVFGDAYILFSDLLGDHRFWLNVTSVANFQNVDAGYLNLRSRLQHYYRVIDFRDFLLVPVSATTFTREAGNRETGGFAGLYYPFNRNYRIEAYAGAVGRDIFDPELLPVDDPNTDGRPDFGFLTFQRLRSTNGVVGAALVGDTLRWQYVGPYRIDPWHGKRFRLEVSGSPAASGDKARYVDYELDYRAYGRVTRRSLVAFRLSGRVTGGEGATVFGVGGYNQIRGYRFREFIGDRAGVANVEFRFPLVDDLRFPFGSITAVRGLFFLDVGASWTQDGYFFDRELGNAGRTFRDPIDPNIVYSIPTLSPGVFRDFKFYDSDKRKLRDGRASYGLGFNFRLGLLELNWTFAKRFPYQQIDRTTCERDIDQAIFDLVTGSTSNFGDLAAAVNTCEFETVGSGTWHSDFYIGYAF